MQNLGDSPCRESEIPGDQQLKSQILKFGWLIRRLIRRCRCLILSWLHDAPGLQVGAGSIIRGSGNSLKFGKGFYANGAVWIEAVQSYAGEKFQPRISIGNRVFASNGLHISCIDQIEIGDDVLFGSHVLVADHQHGQYHQNPSEVLACPPALRPLRSRGPVRIGPRCWIGDHVVIMDRVTIGEAAIIGANSVVTHDIPAGCIAVGAPARVIKSIDPASRDWSKNP